MSNTRVNIDLKSEWWIELIKAIDYSDDGDPRNPIYTEAYDAIREALEDAGVEL